MRAITTNDAPSFDLPFSQALEEDGKVYVSGQVPIDPETGELVDGDIDEQTTRTMKNVQTILEAADTSLENALKVTLYVTEIDKFDAVNDAYRQFVTEPYPARTAVEVSDLAIDAEIEVDVVATT